MSNTWNTAGNTAFLTRTDMLNYISKAIRKKEYRIVYFVYRFLGGHEQGNASAATADDEGR